MTIFDCLNEVTSWKTGTLTQEDDFDKVWNNFMIIRFLTFSKNKEIKKVGLDCARNNFYKLSKEELYTYLLSAIKKTPFANIKYTKKPESKKEKEVEEQDVIIEFGTSKKSPKKKSTKKTEEKVPEENQCNLNIFNLFD